MSDDTRARVGWEWRLVDGRSWAPTTGPATHLAHRNSVLRASVDGGEPRTPADWLFMLRIHDDGDPGWKDAYAVLHGLLGGTE